MKFKSPFKECDEAYKRGIKAYKNGYTLRDNPYCNPKVVSRSHTSHSSWTRGWLVESIKKMKKEI
jgi:hypothetical protein